MLDRLQVLLPKEENYIEVTPLGIKLGMEVIQSWLKDRGRTLTEEQWEKVKDAIVKCNLAALRSTCVRRGKCSLFDMIMIH